MTSHPSEELGPDHRNEPPEGKKRRHDVARQVCCGLCDLYRRYGLANMQVIIRPASDAA